MAVSLDTKSVHKSQNNRRLKQLSFASVFQLLDLCVLDVESLQFTYSVMAASALYHSSSRELALSVSGWYTRLHWFQHGEI